jgi:hypothetical protein
LAYGITGGDLILLELLYSPFPENTIYQSLGQIDDPPQKLGLLSYCDGYNLKFSFSDELSESNQFYTWTNHGAQPASSGGIYFEFMNFEKNAKFQD